MRFRINVYCDKIRNNFLEGRSGWKNAKAEVMTWMEKEKREWICPTGKRFILEQELKMPRYTVCPHCRGRMSKTAEWMDYPYDCHGCGRGWRIDSKKRWHALFSGGMEVYSREEVREEQHHKKLYEWRNAN